MKKIRQSAIAAFSLLELLIVIAIIGVLTVLTIPAVSSVLAGRSLDSAGSQIAGNLALARQMAVASGKRTRWEMADVGSGTNDYRVHRITQFKNGAWEPVVRWSEIPGTVRLNDDIARTSLVALATTSAPFTFQGSNYTGRTVIPVEFLPDGSTTLTSPGSGYLSLVPAQGTSNNWLCVVINPLTGAAQIHRP